MDSYKIEIPHFYCLDYYEGNKIMKIDIDFRDPIIYLNIGLITNWLSPNENVEVTKWDKERILKNSVNILVMFGFSFNAVTGPQFSHMRNVSFDQRPASLHTHWESCNQATYAV